MANNIATKEQLQLFAQEIEESCPILEDAVFLDQQLRGGEGKKIKVSIPDPGVTVVKRGGIPTITGSNPDISNLDVNEFEKEFEVCVATNACSVDDLENATDISNFEKQIIKPRSASVGAGIQDDIVKYGWTCVDSAYKTVVGANFDGFGLLSDMSGDLSDARVKGEIVGYMAGSIESKIAKTASEKFNGNSTEEEKRKGKIGEYAGIEWKRTAMPAFVASDIKSDWKVSAVSEGDETITINGTATNAITANTTIKKGSAFTISGIYKKDVLRGDMIQQKVFVVQEDATGVATGNGSITVKVGAINASGSHANVSALPAANATVANFLTATKKYAVVWAFSKGNVFYNGVKLPSGGNKVVEGASDNGKVLMSAIVHSDGDRKGFYRFDSGYIGGAVDSRRAVVGYIQLD